MKKFTKVVMIIAAVCFSIGVVCLVGAASMGLTWGRLGEMVNRGRFSFSIPESEDKEQKTEEKGTYIEEYCRDLDIELGAGALEIKYHDAEQIYVEEKNVSNYKCYVEEATLHIKGGNTINVGNNDGRIVLWLPTGMEFQEVDIEVGAGEADVKIIRAKELDVKVGAGEINMTVAGKETDYHYELDCKVGTIVIGDDSYEGLGRDKEYGNPNAIREMSVECGAGEINIQFEE